MCLSVVLTNGFHVHAGKSLVLQIPMAFRRGGSQEGKLHLEDRLLLCSRRFITYIRKWSALVTHVAQGKDHLCEVIQMEQWVIYACY
jgi:hypothetical protein